MSRPLDLPGEALPPLARSAIGERLGLCPASPAGGLDPRLLAVGASFVTLRLDGALRGCVGSLEARRPLAEDVENNARCAAFEDTRFPPLAAPEFEALRIDVSVLGPLRPLAAADERELLDRLRPGEDGLLLVAAGRRATFLPQVWASVPDAASFVRQLRRKAGLDADFWRLAPSFFRYRVREWGEEPSASSSR